MWRTRRWTTQTPSLDAQSLLSRRRTLKTDLATGEHIVRWDLAYMECEGKCNQKWKCDPPNLSPAPPWQTHTRSKGPEASDHSWAEDLTVTPSPMALGSTSWVLPRILPWTHSLWIFTIHSSFTNLYIYFSTWKSNTGLGESWVRILAWLCCMSFKIVDYLSRAILGLCIQDTKISKTGFLLLSSNWKTSWRSMALVCSSVKWRQYEDYRCTQWLAVRCTT